MPEHRVRFTRHRIILVLICLLLATGTLMPFAIAAQETVAPRQLGEEPSYGGVRPGPVGTVPGVRKPGVLPVALRIQSVNIDAPIEQQQIKDGVMQNPTGPFVVAWYKETGRLGELNNMVLAGHLDYWDVGPAVFYDVWKVKEGDRIEVLGKNDKIYVYEVEWLKNYKLEDLDTKGIQEIVGPTNLESITLITCGGPFDYEAGQYKERIVIRGVRVPSDES
jgi:LPXTG-site transpeptidase (sortase) family protein